MIETNVEAIGERSRAARRASSVNSVVGVGAVFNEVADDGLITVLRFIGVISLALGIFNLLPILPLDGGHILFAMHREGEGLGAQPPRPTSARRSSASRS